MPHGKNLASFLICTLKKIDLKPFFEKTIKQHPLIKERLKHAEMLHKIYGFINYNSPKTAIQGKSLLTGEAAGFQDAMFGFGMKYAIFSGYFAAQSIMNGLNYDYLWKNSFKKELDMHMLGNKFFKTYSSNYFWDKIIKKFGVMSIETWSKLWSSKIAGIKFATSALKSLL
jgi:flavin-dependent dehydrogenase